MTQHTTLHSRRFTFGLAGSAAATIALVAAGRVLAAPTLTALTAAAPAATASDNLALRWHPEIFVQGNLDLADQIITPDFAWHAPGIPYRPDWSRRRQDARHCLSHRLRQPPTD